MEKDFYGLPVLCTADLSNNIISHISINLVANTRCSNHGVPNKLKIFLQGKSFFNFGIYMNHNFLLFSI